MQPQLKLRTIGIRDYSVLEGPQRIGRIRFAAERNPGIWIWHIQVHLTGGLPMGSCQDLEAAKAEFKTTWETLKARTTPEQLAAASARGSRIRRHDVGWLLQTMAGIHTSRFKLSQATRLGR